MIHPIAAISVMGQPASSRPMAEAFPNAAERSMNPSLQALHESGDAKDFASHFKASATASPAHDASPVESIRKAVESVMHSHGFDMSKLFDTTTGPGSTLQEIVESNQRSNIALTQMSSQFTSAGLELSVAMALSSMLTNHVGSLLKSE